MKRPFIAVTALTLATAISFTSVAEERPASEKRFHTVQINSLEDLKAYFRYDPERDIIVSGHRGGMMPGYPENCIESCEKTLSMMPTFFEIDFSFTKDSVMVLMHDLTIDRTTTGKGRVADYTYEELQGFRLVDRDGKLTPYRIPRLKDMLEWGARTRWCSTSTTSTSTPCCMRAASTMTSITGSSDKVKNQRATGGFATCATWCRNPI